MRNSYIIDVTRDQEKNLYNLLTGAKMKIETIVGYPDSNKFGYVVSLSKYELLFVRLEAKAERIQRLHNVEDENINVENESDI